MSTFVSSTNSRCPSRGLVLSSRESPGAVFIRALAGPGSETLRCFKYFLRVAGNFHLAPLAPEDARAIQQKRASLDAQVLLTVETLLVDEIEQHAEIFFRIGKKREGQALLYYELVVRFNAVARYADNVNACLAELAVQVPEILALPGAAARHVLGIEIDHQLAARGLFNRPGTIAVRGQCEILDPGAELGSCHL